MIQRSYTVFFEVRFRNTVMEEPQASVKPSRAAAVRSAILRFPQRNPVLCISFVLAVVTSFIIPPDAAYRSYIDLKTVSCLFCVLAVVCALKNIRFFSRLAEGLVVLTGNLRLATVALVCVTFIGSMLIANDMALLTFLPLGYFVLASTGTERYMAPVFILQNIAANLGGMLTPFGNPQNLYLYSHFNIPDGEFLRIMFPPFLLSIALILACCFLLPRSPISLQRSEKSPLPLPRTLLYLALFALAIVMVFRVIPYWIGLCVIPAVLLVADRRALGQVDYGLLFTFVCFFVFAGNLSRVEPVRELLGNLLGKNPLVVSALSCQVISNVPSAILLSRFTSDYRSLLLGVNIGGTGTLIASLASLITFREYVRHNPNRKRYYLGVFSAFNFSFLAVLLVFSSLVG